MCVYCTFGRSRSFLSSAGNGTLRECQSRLLPRDNPVLFFSRISFSLHFFFHCNFLFPLLFVLMISVWITRMVIRYTFLASTFNSVSISRNWPAFLTRPLRFDDNDPILVHFSIASGQLGWWTQDKWKTVRWFFWANQMNVCFLYFYF